MLKMAMAILIATSLEKKEMMAGYYVFGKKGDNGKLLYQVIQGDDEKIIYVT